MIADARPQWIARMENSKGGLDHLGLNSVSSDQILPTLSPSVNVLTFHPRYHSFYSWVLYEFWQRELPRTHAAFRAFYRPREFIFSVGANLCDHPEHGKMRNIVGSSKTAAIARSGPTFDTRTSYIDSALGGYGLYYRVVLAQLGLVAPGGPGLPTPFDWPTARGKRLAERFREAIADTAYYREYHACDALEVPKEVVREYIQRACLCQLQAPDAPDRTLLLDAFLHVGAHGVADARRATFRLLLDLAEQTDGYALLQDQYRELLYFGHSISGATYQPQEATRETYLHWQLYQAREYFAFALNALWCGLCDWGIRKSGGWDVVPLSAIWFAVDEHFALDAVTTRLGLATPDLSVAAPFTDLLGWLQELVGSDANTFWQRCGWDAPLNEHALYRLILANRSDPRVMVTAPLLLLATIALRFWQLARYPADIWRIAEMGGQQRISMAWFLRELGRRMQRGPLTIGDLLRVIFRNNIILQHELVAQGKLPENTFRFRSENAGLRFFPLETPLGFMDSRYQALSTTLTELGLCAPFGQHAHTLTPDGERLLRDGDITDLETVEIA